MRTEWKRLPFDKETLVMAEQYAVRKKLEKHKRDLKMKQLVIDHFCKTKTKER